MIDEKEKGNGEDNEDIIVELPEEKPEDKAEEAESEELKDTAAPEEETEETEEESIEVEAEVEEAEESKEESKETKVFGKRAEKRIKRLVAQKKELEEKLKGYEEDKSKWLDERNDLKHKQADSELDAINQYIDRLGAQEKQALSTLRTAKEASDVDSEIKATDVLASVKAEALVAKQYKARAERDLGTTKSKSSSRNEETKVDKKPKQPPLPDRKALAWQKRNHWFGGQKTGERIKTQAALVVHKELIDEGITPQDGPEEYYSELDARLQVEFPDLRSKTVRKVPTVVGGTRSAPGKRKVRLSRTELEMADRLNVSYEEYARQKLRQDEMAGG